MNTLSLRWWCLAAIVTVGGRLLLGGAYPLTDTTEARYAEVARMMLVLNDWAIPHIEPDIPFLAKPPLAFWPVASSFLIFGIDEWSARLPALMIWLACAALLTLFRIDGEQPIKLPVAIVLLFATPLGFVAAGSVMTDPMLTLCFCLSMVGLWQTIGEDDRRWWPAVFAGLGLGILAKGLVAPALLGLTALLWTLWARIPLTRWLRLPWVPGLALCGLIAAPWYLYAEHRHPGFLEYFFVGEHLHRFLEQGWEGDRYGTAHSEPPGMIVLFALASVFPFWLCWRWWLPAGDHVSARRSLWQRFLWTWALSPLLLFALSGNILPTYVMPSLPAVGLLLAPRMMASRRWVPLGCSLLVPVLAVAMVLGPGAHRIDQRSFRTPVLLAQEEGAALVYVGATLPHSARFYAAKTLERVDDIEQAAACYPAGTLILDRRARSALPEVVQARLHGLGAHGRQQIYRLTNIDSSPASDCRVSVDRRSLSEADMRSRVARR